MGVLDKFLDIMRLTDEDDYEDDEFFDDDYEDDYEEKPKKGAFSVATEKNPMIWRRTITTMSRRHARLGLHVRAAATIK